MWAILFKIQNTLIIKSQSTLLFQYTFKPYSLQIRLKPSQTLGDEKIKDSLVKLNDLIAGTLMYRF
jgi:hypothetical protein